MSRPVLYLAITNHGFGHAVRMATVASQVQKFNPEILLIIVTTAPRWLLESYIEGDFIHRLRAFDVGVIQSDSLTMDLKATLGKMQEYCHREEEIVAGEVDFLRLNKVGLILADIPGMVSLIAEKAGIPCWMMGNFGWDFIYQAWGDDFREVTHWLRSRYEKVERLFRLPLAEEMASFPFRQDVGLTGGNPRYGEAFLRDKFNLNKPKEKTVLLTFGGLGLEAIPYHNLNAFRDWQFITFDQNAPDFPNLLKICRDSAHLRPVDFMPICGKVVSKPGYSTFAESLRLDIPLVSITRNGFAEAEILLDGLRHYGYHRIVDYGDFLAGDWGFLREDAIAPLGNEKLDKDGTEFIAQEIVKFLSSKG